MHAYNANSIIVATSTLLLSVRSSINMTSKIALVTAGVGRGRREGGEARGEGRG